MPQAARYPGSASAWPSSVSDQNQFLDVKTRWRRRVLLLLATGFGRSRDLGLRNCRGFPFHKCVPKRICCRSVTHRFNLIAGIVHRLREPHPSAPCGWTTFRFRSEKNLNTESLTGNAAGWTLSPIRLRHTPVAPMSPVRFVIVAAAIVGTPLKCKTVSTSYPDCSSWLAGRIARVLTNRA